MAERFFSQPSVMTAQQHFSAVPSADIQRSRFDRSHAVKTTFDASKLIPIFVDEVLPGDTFTHNSTIFARLATPLRPIMDNMYMDVHYWFVPNRLVWDEWQMFMGERPTPNFDPNTVVMPTVNWVPPTDPDTQNTVGTYFGLPRIRDSSDVDQLVSALPFRAYLLIWNEWYRDQNLQTPYDLLDDNDFTPLPRNKRHDYFTSCLPWPQKGDPVSIPIAGGGTFPVIGDPDAPVSPFVYFNQSNGSSFPINIFWDGSLNPTATRILSTDSTASLDTSAVNGSGVRLGNPLSPVGYVTIDDFDAVTVNDLRTAFQIQKLLERDARGGTRYIELILSHFGVRSDDARLQRPELLAASTTRVNINPIASTATVPDQAPQANLAGVGTVVNKAGYQKAFTEHGFIIGLASVRADLTYQRGIERFWSRKTRYDFYWPTLAHLGEQAVLNKEIYYSGTAVDEEVFGYQERYAEYRYKPSLITGAFNSNYDGSLDSWHLSQDFNLLPRLNSSFIMEQVPVDRIIAVPDEPHFLCDIWHDLKCQRPMPIYSVPGLIDHF